MSSIAATTSGLANSQLGAQISMAVAEKGQNVAKAQGQAAVSLIQDAAALQQQTASTSDPHRGNLVDLLG